jgi:hypothetical protein
MGRSRQRAEPLRDGPVRAAPARAWELAARWAWPASGVLALALAFLLATFPTVSDDLFMHLAAGRWFFRTGSFPDPDPWLASVRDYSRAWIDVAYWGAHLGAEALHELGGFALIGVLKALLVALGAAAPLWLARRIGERSFLVPAALAVALWAASNRFIERGSLVSDCLGPWVLALVISELARPSRLRWALPPIFLVWTNLHPGVMTGLVFVAGAAFLQWRAWRRWLPLLAACTAAALLHPDGAAHLVWALGNAPGAASGAFRRHNVEMMPTLSAVHVGTREVRLFFALAAGALLVLGWAFWRRARPWYELLVVAALCALGLSAVRYASTASLALPVAIVGALGAARRAGAPPPRAGSAAWRANAAGTALVALVSAGLCAKLALSGYTAASGVRRPGFGLDRAAYPFGAARFLESIPYEGALFNEHSWGTFLCWLWDGRPGVHYHGYMLDERFYERDYVGVNASAAEFDRIVAQYDLGAFLLRRLPAGPQRGPLVYRLLITRPEWRLVYWDQRSVVFLRDRPGHEALLAEHGYRFLDPYRPELLSAGLQREPARVLDEAVRQLHDQPSNLQAREIVEKLFQQDADELVSRRYGAPGRER